MRVVVLVIAMLASFVAAPAATARSGSSSATITGAFSDACRDFATHSSKDISHVEVGYADGRVVKDETINRPEYSLDGGPGGEIAYAVVKSGTTSQRFACAQSNTPPIARLEILTPDDTACHPFFESGLYCDQTAARTTWRSTAGFPTAPDPVTGWSQEAGHLLWGCVTGAQGWSSGGCSLTFHFRGTGSSDADNDITTWSLEFCGEGTAVSGSWADPPATVAHTYDLLGAFTPCDEGNHFRVTLTVTDSAGQSASDTITMGFIDESPD
jgi:hypothetical protein